RLHEEDRQVREHIVIPVKPLLEEVAQHYSSLEQQDIQIGIEMDVAVDVAPVWIVHDQVSDILRNLFVNAVQAMPEGGMVTLRARNAGRYVELQVEDTGIGIKPGDVSKIFNLFYSTKGSFGFGLWSARRNALANGGDLRVESLPGHRTT